MKNKLIIVQVLLGFIILATFNDILGDIRDYNLENLKRLKIWNDASGDTDKTLFNIKSNPWLEFSYYAIQISLLVMKAYLLLGFYYLLCIFYYFDKEQFFSETISRYFKKAGHVFLTYCITVFVLKLLYNAIFYEKPLWKNLFKLEEGFSILFACGFAFYIFGEIIKKGKALQEENDLTV
jgi:Protein of unknown function (DUF2975)